MPSIRIKEESFEGSLRRFKRMCEKAGVYAEMRRHEFYEKKTWKRKRQKAAAKKRLLKRLARERIPTRGRTEKAKDTRRDGRGGRSDYRNRDNQATS